MSHSFSCFGNKRMLSSRLTCYITELTEYLTNAALLKTFACLDAVNLFLLSCSTSAVSSVGVSRLYSYISPTDTRHTRLFSLCTRSRPLWFWQNKHWNFPLFFFFSSSKRVMSSYWIFYFGTSWLLRVWTLPDAQLMNPEWPHGGAVFIPQASQVSKMTTKGTCCCPHTQAWS